MGFTEILELFGHFFPATLSDRFDFENGFIETILDCPTQLFVAQSVHRLVAKVSQ